MSDVWERSRPLVGDDGVAALQNSRVIVFGAGGVGGFACEALARCGVGDLTIVDGDVVAVSNLNRQLAALHSTLGRNKAEVLCERIQDINPGCIAHARPVFYTKDNWSDWPLDGYDAIVDAVDMVSAKVELVVRAHAAGVFIVSAMGAGNRLSPQGFAAGDLYETAGCPLARVMRRELKRRGVHRLRVVSTTRPPAVSAPDTPGRHPPASMVFAPATAGLLLAHEVVTYLLEKAGAKSVV